MIRPTFVVALLASALAGCTSSGSTGLSGAASPSTDARVRSFLGQAPPDLAAEARWLRTAPTSLAAHRGQVVFLQFAFPT